LTGEISKPTDVAAKAVSTGPGARTASATSAKRAPAEDIAVLKQRYGQDTKDAKAALAYARALKATGKLAEALPVIERAREAHPANRDLVLAAALMQLELGRAKPAAVALAQLAAAGDQDWRVYSALGVAASSQGRQGEAQKHFAKALQMSPGNPAVLNNLAIAQLLDRKVDQAELTLRQAANMEKPAPQVSQNLLLAGGLKARRGGEGDKTKVTALSKSPESSLAAAPVPVAKAQ
jgi:Flp pilus assembly protein TadD